VTDAIVDTPLEERIDTVPPLCTVAITRDAGGPVPVVNTAVPWLPYDVDSELTATSSELAPKVTSSSVEPTGHASAPLGISSRPAATPVARKVVFTSEILAPLDEDAEVIRMTVGPRVG
jgi:hypothetical protein